MDERLKEERHLREDNMFLPYGREAMLSSGYSPLLAFDVDDLDATVVRLLKMGAALDGPIRYPEHGKVRGLGSGSFEERIGIYWDTCIYIGCLTSCSRRAYDWTV